VWRVRVRLLCLASLRTSYRRAGRSRRCETRRDAQRIKEEAVEVGLGISTCEGRQRQGYRGLLVECPRIRNAETRVARHTRRHRDLAQIEGVDDGCGRTVVAVAAYLRVVVGEIERNW